MINLLPPELKEAYRYAHRNVRLVGWVTAFAVSFVGLLAISTAGLIYINQTDHMYVKQIASQKQELKSQNIEATQAKVKEMAGSLKLAVQVLSHEVLFSKLLARLATVMPSNVALKELTLSPDDAAIDIAAMSSNYASATQLQVNMIDPANRIFAKADINQIVCSSSGSSNPRYPCIVFIRALLAPNSPFLFINDGKSS